MFTTTSAKVFFGLGFFAFTLFVVVAFSQIFGYEGEADSMAIINALLVSIVMFSLSACIAGIAILEKISSKKGKEDED